MAYPDLYQDEQKILEAQNVKVKSVSFTAVLTNRRLILIDSKRHTLPPQEIMLATLKNVDGGENAIRDPTITISILLNTGTTRQMILTFARSPGGGGERKRECDEWVKSMRHNISTIIEHPVIPEVPSLSEISRPPAPEPAPVASPPPRIEVVNAPAQKKRIEISRPIKKIVESAPAMPAPVETTSLPTGSFCNRCGSRVPPESAFCNRCGTPVVRDSDLDAMLKRPQPVAAIPVMPVYPAAPPAPPVPVAAEPAPVLAAEEVPASFFEPEIPVTSPPVQAVPYFANESVPETPVVPQVAVPVPSVFGAHAEKRERPIEEVIHSIEPLIEDSVPRTTPAPLVPRSIPYRAPDPEPEPAPVPVPVVPAPLPEPILSPAPVSEPQAKVTIPPTDTGVQWPVLPAPAPASESPGSPAPSSAGTPAVPLPEPARSGRRKLIAIAIGALVVLAVIAGIVLIVKPFGTPESGTTTPVPTMIPTTVPTPVATRSPVPTPTPAPEPAVTSEKTAVITGVQTPAPSTVVPDSGVWVWVKYNNEFSGAVGTPNAMTEVKDKGEKFYRISTSTGTVAATIQKVDGSGDALTVEVYKDGELVIEKSTTAPKGTVEIQISLKPKATPVPTTLITPVTIPTETSSGNTTANATTVN